MYDAATRKQMRALMAAGSSLNSLSKRTGINRATLRDWRARPERDLTDCVRSNTCPRCSHATLTEPEYSYLLGMYLGDGCISVMKKGVYSLRISCDTKYAGIIAEVSDAIRAVKPGANVHLVHAPGCVQVSTFWKHWPCLFPQHGAGRKHERRIVLVQWQQRIVERHSGLLLRGLFHSDGCRILNWTVRPVAGQQKRYEYPRYIFSNESRDIREICTDALDRLGIQWTRPRSNLISVARKGSVALLDQYVGPKS